MSNYTQTTQVTSTAIDELDSLRMNFHFAIDQANADRDFWMNDSQEKGKQLEQKDRIIDQRNRRIAKLEQDYLNYRNTLTLERNVIFHPKIQQCRDRVLLLQLMRLETRKTPDEDGFFECYRGDIAREAHLSEDATSDGLKSLVKHGTIELDHRSTEIKGNKNILRVKILPAVKDDTLNCVTKEVKSNYGGERAIQCPECHKERIKKTRKKATLCQCMDCKHQWVEDESEKVIKEAPVTAQDYADREPDPQPGPGPEPEPQSTLFTFESDPKPTPVDTRLPQRACFKCGAQEWQWDEVFELPKCGRCG